MKIQKKFYALVLSATLVLSIGTLTSFASNHKDTTFTFNFPIGKNVAYINARPKENNTSAYMKLQKLQGATYPSYTASVVKSNYTNFSKTWYYTFNSTDINKGRYLSNYAREDGYTNIRIKAVKGGDKNGFYGSGLWSPDSI